MFLQQFYTGDDSASTVSISAEQGSGFAKTISNDFNPIHDIDSKRFCVPGDLLFALVLERYGLSQQMRFEFSGMVSADTPLVMPDSPADQFENFPHILVPLMAEKNVMINPQRPLVIYESMSLELETLALDQPSVELAGTSLEVDGKRGNAEFRFSLTDGGKIVGTGVKTLILSGLREYQQEAIDLMVATYLDNQARHCEA